MEKLLVFTEKKVVTGIEKAGPLLYMAERDDHHRWRTLYAILLVIGL